MKRMTIVMALVLMALSANMVSAQIVLWDQTVGYETWEMGFFNMNAGAPPFGMTVYTVNDIVVPVGGWQINTIRVIYDGFDPSWAGGVTMGTLYIEPKTGALPTGDPATGTAVTVAGVILGNGFLEISATGLGQILDEGEYWIGLTPNAPNTENIHVSVPAVGDASPSYDTGGFPMPMWGNWVAGLDGAMMIEGQDAVATDTESWGGVKSLYR